MNLEEFNNYCLAKKGVEGAYPFKGECVWMKVMGKMFALTNVMDLKINGTVQPPFYLVNLKCDPERAVELREAHAAIAPGWHQSKVHWNSLLMDGSLPDELVYELIDHSYDIVVAGLTGKLKAELAAL